MKFCGVIGPVSGTTNKARPLGRALLVITIIGEGLSGGTPVRGALQNENTGISADMLFELSKALGVSLAEIFSHAKIWIVEL